MRIAFLGTAAAITTENRDNTSFLVGDTLIECSGNAFGKMRKLGYNPLRLKNVIITHGHVDHVYGLPSLVEMMRLSGRENPLKIYVSEVFSNLVKTYLGMFNFMEKERRFPVEVEEIRYGFQLIDEDLIIEFFPVKHSVENFGLKIKSFDSIVVYSSDTEPCKEVIEQSFGADLLIHEATCSYLFSKRIEGHTCAEDAARIAQQCGVKILCLVHLGPDINNEKKLIDELKKFFLGDILIPGDLEKIIL